MTATDEDRWIRVVGSAPTGESVATFSHDFAYRYSISRTWDLALPRLVVVMLNPSTAGRPGPNGQIRDDATVRRVVGFAKREGCGGYTGVNLFGLVSTDPRGLLGDVDPVGYFTGHHMRLAVLAPVVRPRVIVAWGAWGGHPKLVRRTERVLAELRDLGAELEAFGVTRFGQPVHPLRLRADTPLRPVRLGITDDGPESFPGGGDSGG